MSDGQESEPYVDDRSLAERVNDVLTDLLAEEGGGFVSAFILVADYIDADGDDAWIQTTADGQRMSTTLGLLKWAEGVAKFEQKQFLHEITSED